jgi:acetoacetate decarboxylase
MTFNLKGAGIPLSPSGKTSYRMEAQKYSGRVIYILFRPDVEILKQFIPPPLEMPETPYAFLKLYELKRRFLDKPYADPVFSHYNEAVISTVANFQGEPGHFNLYMWVTKDWATWKAREVLGWPKKLADISLTKHFHEEELAPPEQRLEVSVSRYGNTIIRASIEINRKSTPDELPRFKYFYSRRIIPNPGEKGASLDQLIRVEVQDGKIGNMLGGNATIDFSDCHDEEIECLNPKEIMGGYYFPIEWVLPAYPGEIIYEYGED